MKKHIKVVCSNINNKMIEMNTYLDECMIHTVFCLNDGSPIIECHGEWGNAVLKKLGDDKVDLGPIVAKIVSKLTYIEGVEGLNSWSFTVEEDVDVADKKFLSFAYKVDGDTALLTISALGKSRSFSLHRDENCKWVLSEDFTMFYELKSFAHSTNMKDNLIMNCLVESLNDFNDRQVSPFFFIHELYE